MENPEQTVNQEKLAEYRQRAGLSEKERSTVKEQTEKAKLDTKFFNLEIGEEALIFVDTSKTMDFKNKNMKTGDLQNQYRYFIDDLRGDEPIQKTFDTFPNVAVQINNTIDETGSKLILMRCHKGKQGGKNYRAYAESEYGKQWTVNIADLEKEENDD